MSDRETLLQLLQDIQSELEFLSLWEPVSPPPAAFESNQPFCYDTLQFSQWLQWVFIARFRALLQGNLPLPAACCIAPMAEEALRERESSSARLLQLLQRFDACFETDTR